MKSFVYCTKVLLDIVFMYFKVVSPHSINILALVSLNRVVSYT